MSDILIIGIAGGTGSGKTTIARRLAASIPEGECMIIEHDWYYHDNSELTEEERTALNYDHPDSLDTELLIKHLQQLRAGQSIGAPQYDFSQHRRCKESVLIRSTPIIIVEGILTFVDRRLRELFDIKLFVDTDADIRVFRRIRRDIEQRDRTFISVRDQYYSSVRPMHVQFVEPSKRWADLIIPEGGDNHVAIDVILSKLLRATSQALEPDRRSLVVE